jgi:hypothetical protein
LPLDVGRQRPAAAFGGLVFQQEDLLIREPAGDQLLAQGTHAGPGVRQLLGLGIVVHADQEKPFLAHRPGAWLLGRKSARERKADDRAE